MVGIMKVYISVDMEGATGVVHREQLVPGGEDYERSRKLLMHKREIFKIGQRIAEKGLTLIPLRVYFKHGIVKVELGLCKGKHTIDKRNTIRDRDIKRDMEREMKDRR